MDSKIIIDRRDYDRLIELLNAATLVIDPYGEVYYDEAHCDGHCLIEDINSHTEYVKDTYE